MLQRRGARAWRPLVAGALAAVALQAAPVGLTAATGSGSAASTPRAVDIASEAGIAEITRTWSANVVDLDGNGPGDWLLVRHDPQAIWSGKGEQPTASLYRKARGRFDEVTRAFGHTDKHDCDFADVDLDGDMDLFCAVGLDRTSTNELWKQTARGRFRNASTRYGLEDATSGHYRTVTFIHANGDLYPDVYVTRYYGPNGPRLNDEAESSPRPNELYINVDGRRFRRAPKRGLDRPIGAHKDTPGCAQAVDFDRDKRQDLLVCGDKGLRLYRNGKKRFRNVTRLYGIGGRVKDARLAHLNADRRRDLVLVRDGLVEIRMWRRGTWRRAWATSLAAGEGVATGDFDGDGRTDIYVLQACTSGRDRPDLILLNRREDWDVHRVPGVAQGCGNDVETIDFYGKDGRSDFIVLNGKQRTAGPVQLLTYR